MATVSFSRSKAAKKHIEDGMYTLCGKPIPPKGKEWNLFGEATCKNCLKKQNRLEDN